MSGAVAAVDLGATSGRVMLGWVGSDTLRLEHLARFPNGPLRVWENGAHTLHWNLLGLYQGIITGLTDAVRAAPDLASIGVDSWAVDYALFYGGSMIRNPYHYRDDRTTRGARETHEIISHAQLYRRNGLQFLPFNTLYQLKAEDPGGALSLADSLLLVPDTINFWLTGSQAAEATNASTTGLLSLQSGTWDWELMETLGIPAALFPHIVQPGSSVGTLLPEVQQELGTNRAIDVVAVGSHDTASAVVAVPMVSETAAFISCGTWGLVGVELDSPVLTDESLAANFTNEGGVDGTVRFLHNVMGLWLLSETLRTWERSGEQLSLQQLLAEAAVEQPAVDLFDVNDPVFLPPGDMPERVSQYLGERGLRLPSSRAQMIRCILDSLAEAFAEAVRTAALLSGKKVSTIHIVGGGALNTLLCQLVADRSGMRVLAGPVEATAIGNILVQARSSGLLVGSLDALRSLVGHVFPPEVYYPRTGFSQD